MRPHGVSSETRGNGSGFFVCIMTNAVPRVHPLHESQPRAQAKGEGSGEGMVIRRP